MNIGSCLAINARRHPEKWAVTFEDKEYTYNQLNQVVNQLAHGLLNLGVKKGDKVALLLKNSDYFVISIFAVAKIGAVVVPLNFRLMARELNYILEQSDSVVVLYDQEFDDIIYEAKQDVHSIRQVIAVASPNRAEHLSIKEVLSENIGEPEVEVKEEDDLHILYTSGTTGYPKGALFDHKRVLNLVIASIGTTGLASFEKLLHVAPLFHSAQLGLYLIPGISVGASHVIHKEFNPVEVLKAIEKYDITQYFGVPTMYNFLLQVPNAKEYNLSSIKKCSYGAAPMAPELVTKSMELFQTDQFYNLCGLSEGGPAGIFLTPEDHKKNLGASGKDPTLLTEARVVNEQGQDVVPGEVGEFILRGETIMKEYYRKEKETQEALREGWLFTGDLAVKDEHGFIKLVDRKKDMIISGGENVYSIEVENCLYQHPDVMEAAVIGIPDTTWGEIVTAVVVLHKQKGDEEELISFLRQHLAGYKVPRKILFVDQLPRNASGKIMKYKLREQFNEVKER
ncbi:class I adenylate-forming enzyme family protein [Cytobacillus sp. Hm23]